LDSITIGILSGESYDGICALADLFAVVKIPTTFLATLPGTKNPGDDAKKCQQHRCPIYTNFFEFGSHKEHVSSQQ
jgi:hypothetical protein